MNRHAATPPRSHAGRVGGRPAAPAHPPALVEQDRRVLVTLRLWRAAAAATAGLPDGRYQTPCPVCAALGQPENVLTIERAKGRLAGLACAGWGGHGGIRPTAFARIARADCRVRPRPTPARW